ncbi:MAG: S41 family peptidase [Verrucomicrobia bacterium]|nr:S41 family peptidase [Verrucomicrobiota bacterium]
MRPSPLPRWLGRIALFLLASALSAQAPPTEADLAVKPLGAEERRQVITELARELEARFVFPEVARAYAEMLRRKLTEGTYERLTDPREFARQLTDDLQAVSPDRHLRVSVGDGVPPGMRRGPGAPAGAGLEEARMLGRVAYLRFNLFPDSEEVAARARQFLLDHADATAVILDSRTNRGGTARVMDAILPLLYAEQRELVRMDTRAAAAAGAPPMDAPSMVLRPSPPEIVRRDHVVIPDQQERRLQKVPVFYLTSKRTGSAAEHLALAFKRTGRATLIGETTGGAGHYGGVTRLGERFAVFIPIGRTYYVDTNRGWEGTGVVPDVAVPAEQALEEALRRAGAAAAP